MSILFNGETISVEDFINKPREEIASWLREKQATINILNGRIQELERRNAKNEAMIEKALSRPVIIERKF